MADVAERLLTARQVADMLCVSAETVLRWTRAGKLPAIRLPGGAIRYQPAAIKARLAEWSTTATGDGATVLSLDGARGEA